MKKEEVFKWAATVAGICLGIGAMELYLQRKA